MTEASTSFDDIPPATKSRRKSVCVGDVFDDYLTRLMNDDKPKRFVVGIGPFANVNLCPGRIITIGGLPGAGKTALSLQWVLDALIADPSLRAVVGNVECPMDLLLDRQIARISGVDASTIHGKEFADNRAEIEERIQTAASRIREAVTRLYITEPPFTTEDIREDAVAFGAGAAVLDYIQQAAPDGGYLADDTSNVRAVMRDLLVMKNNGLAVIALSSLRRSLPGAPSAKFAYRGSSDIEYDSDECYTLETDDRPNADGLQSSLLRHDKSRWGAKQDIAMWFDASVQCFTPKESTDD